MPHGGGRGGGAGPTEESSSRSPFASLPVCGCLGLTEGLQGGRLRPPVPSTQPSEPLAARKHEALREALVLQTRDPPAHQTAQQGKHPQPPTLGGSSGLRAAGWERRLALHQCHHCGGIPTPPLGGVCVWGRCSHLVLLKRSMPQALVNMNTTEAVSNTGKSVLRPSRLSYKGTTCH